MTKLQGWEIWEEQGSSVINPRAVSVFPLSEQMRDDLQSKAEAQGLTILEYLRQQFPDLTE
jgi:hypothetical protein